MLKDIIIILLILIVIITVGILTEKYLDNTTQELSSQLSKLKDNIINMKANNENDEEVKKESEAVYENWSEKSEVWSTIVTHTELDEIEKALIRMKSELESGDLDVTLEELDTSIFLINHINEKERLRLKNIL